MKKLDVKIREIQHLRALHFQIELEPARLVCLTGKNGVGKTTLVKALRTLSYADTFSKTSAPDAFSTGSTISYEVDDLRIEFRYDPKLGVVDSKDFIPDELRQNIVAELPLPHGERFNFFQRISGADDDIRRAVALDDYKHPERLKSFLKKIYQNGKFDKLVEITVKGTPYYCILLPELRYIREDYLSSGEYFVIALYRRIVAGQKLIVVDEIDISLDAAAQVRLVENLRELSIEHCATIVFTTHSVALMRSLQPEELFYIDNAASDGEPSIKNISFNHVNSLLFGFTGWDKYILTEDDMLSSFIEKLISECVEPIFYRHKIIHIGGAINTVDLMLRNKTETFLSHAADVITVIDGDQRLFRHAKRENVHLLPFDSIEKAFIEACLLGRVDIKVSDYMGDWEALRDYVFGNSKRPASKWNRLIFNILSWRRTKPAPRPLKESEFGERSKTFYKLIIKDKRLSQRDIFNLLTSIHAESLKPLRRTLATFLCAPPSIAFKGAPQAELAPDLASLDPSVG